MTPLTVKRERFLCDEPSVRLGGLASNTSRLGWLSRQRATLNTARPIFQETKLFAEWTAPDVPLDLQVQLAQLQLELARLERHWGEEARWGDIGDVMEAWTSRLLDASGLTR